MKTSKILITIGLVLSVFALLLAFLNGFIPFIGIILLCVVLWFYFKEKNTNRYAIAFIVIGVVYIILNIPNISIDGLLYLIGGIIVRNGK